MEHKKQYDMLYGAIIGAVIGGVAYFVMAIIKKKNESNSESDELDSDK